MFPSFYVAAAAAAAAAAAKPLTPPPSPHHHLAHLCSTVLASLHHLSDEPRRQLRRRTRQLLDQAALHPTIVLLALFYLRRASQLPADPTIPVIKADHQILASLICAQKFHEDAAYTNKTWSELAGVPVAQVNSLERSLLIRLRHHLSVDPQEFSRWTEQLGRWASQGSCRSALTSTFPSQKPTNSCNNHTSHVQSLPAPSFTHTAAAISSMFPLAESFPHGANATNATAASVNPPVFNLGHRRHLSFDQFCVCASCQAVGYVNAFATVTAPWSPPQALSNQLMYPFPTGNFATAAAPYPFFSIPMPNSHAMGYCWAMPSA